VHIGEGTNIGIGCGNTRVRIGEWVTMELGQLLSEFNFAVVVQPGKIIK
jgi:hypothetical protein